jgi:hypothetical protein
MKQILLKNDDNIKISLSEIENFEKKYNLIFESKYKNFLLNENGGEISSDYVFFYGKKTSHNCIQTVTLYNLERIEEVHNITLDDKDDLESSNYLFLKNKMLTIGDSNLGFSLCISYSKEDFGRIYYIDDDKFIFLANNINEFINNFEDCPKEFL